MLTDQKVAVFIDSQNMYYCTRYMYKAKLDYEKVLEKTVKDRKLIRAIAYIVTTESIDQSLFIDTLKKNNYEVKVKILKTNPDGSKKGNWDMGMAIDAINISSKVDVIVLISGDGDFVDLVHLLKSKGVKVEVATFPYNTSDDLIKSCDEYIELDESVLR